MKTSEVLNRAADEIEERGWGFGPKSMFAEAGICVMGAIHLAHFGRIDDDYKAVHLCPAGQAMFRYVTEKEPEYLDEGLDALWVWNDEHANHERGVPQDGGPEVIAALRACAVIEASREREPAEVSA